MDDPLRLRALYAVGIDVGHDVMAHFLLPRLRHLVIDVLRMGFQFVDLFLRNRKSQLFLGLRQSDPQPSPRTEFFIRRENILHLSAGITLG